MFGRLTALLLSYRRASALLVALVVLLTSAGALRLGADFSVRSFFGRTDPEVAFLDAYLERWQDDDMLVVVVDGGQTGLLTRERLEVIDSFAREAAKLEHVSRVLSVTELPRANRAPGGLWVPVPLLATAPRVEDERMAAWRERLLADPQVVPGYLSADGRYGAVMIGLDVDTADLTEVRPVVHAAEELIARTATGDLRFQVAGVPAIRSDILDVIVHDQLFLVPISGTVMALLLLLTFRSRHGVLIPGVAAGVPLAMLLGVMGWTGEQFNLLNQSFLALVPAMAVANAIHLVSRYHDEGRLLRPDGGPLTRDQQTLAIVQAAEHIGMACLLITITTVIGFLALLQTDLPVLRSYGVYSAIGVAISYFTLLTVVPLLLLTTRLGARRVEHGDEGTLGVVLTRAGDLSTQRPWWMLGAAALVALISGWFGSYVTVNSALTATYDEDHPTTKANRILDEHLGGVLSLDWDLEAPPGTFDQPAVLAALQRLDDAAEARPEVRASVSPATLLRGTSVLMGGPARVPDEGATVQRLYTMLGDDALSAFVNADRSRARALVRVVDVGAVDFLALGEQIGADIEAELAPLGVHPHLTGSSFVTYRGLSRVTVDLRNSLMTSFGVIGVVIALLFRDLWLGLLSLIPNMLPQIFGYGVMGAFGWTLEPAPAVVYTIAVGVSVDSAIHIIARFKEEHAAGRTVDEAVREAIYSAGRAVMITELMLSFAFLVNAYSASPATAAFGKLGAVIILLGPPSNLFVLPALLKLWMEARLRA
jgi:predicted RND superfamily exporter protein